MKVLKLRIKEFSVLVKFFVANLLIVFRPRKNIWLISERGHEARDNGFVFFEFLKKNHKEIDVKYIIDSKSKDFHKLLPYADSIVEYGTFKHYKYLCLSSYLISTHIMGFTPFMDFFTSLDRKFDLFAKQKKIFLQHGIIKDFLPSLMKGSINVDLFCCGAKPEYEYILSNFGYSDKIVKYTGLCRYDNLNKFETKKQILVMPTWRKYERDNEFTLTTFYKCWSSFLEDDELDTLLSTYGYELLFYPHYELQKNIQYFKTQKVSSRIKIADFNYDVQTLLKESCMLITDYSSVYFDMAYMRKPIIFYQFDEEEFRSKHYQRGYIKEEMLGSKCITKEELIEKLKGLLINKMVVEEKYMDYANSFFEMRDDQNYARVYKAIINC